MPTLVTALQMNHRQDVYKGAGVGEDQGEGRFKELAHTIVGTGKSETGRIDRQTVDPGAS